MKHRLKTWPSYFTAVADGTKTFEIRKDDRGFSAGDTLVLQDYDPETDQYSGKELECFVTYLMTGGKFGLMEGYVIMGISKQVVRTMDLSELDRQADWEEHKLQYQKAQVFDRIGEKIMEREKDAILSRDDSKPKSYQYQFFAGYLAALEELAEIIEKNLFHKNKLK